MVVVVVTPTGTATVRSDRPQCPILEIVYWTDSCGVTHARVVDEYFRGCGGGRTACAQPRGGFVELTAFSRTGRITCEECQLEVERRLLSHTSRYS